jgi:hypothetical protein
MSGYLEQCLNIHNITRRIIVYLDTVFKSVVCVVFGDMGAQFALFLSRFSYYVLLSCSYCCVAAHLFVCSSVIIIV